MDTFAQKISKKMTSCEIELQAKVFHAKLTHLAFWFFNSLLKGFVFLESFSIYFKVMIYLIVDIFFLKQIESWSFRFVTLDSIDTLDHV